MPLNSKGEKIKKSMEKEYGPKKGKEVFYASENKGTVKGVKMSRMTADDVRKESLKALEKKLEADGKRPANDGVTS